jgi:predicted HTH transcriptional regulator
MSDLTDASVRFERCKCPTGTALGVQQHRHIHFIEYGKIYGKINGKINSILDILRTNPNATIPDLIEAMGKSRQTVSRELKEYQDAGLLRREGSRKTGYWMVK